MFSRDAQHWLLALLLPLLALLCCPTGSRAKEQPNIVFFFIDDLGWTDVGFMYQYLGRDQQYYETPHIDQLASQSVMFANAYANAPNCAPSRACLMSGKYTPRHGIYTVGDPRRGNHQHRRLEPIENKTVLDDQLVTLNQELNETYIAYGSDGDRYRNNQLEQDRNAGSMSTAAVASRAVTKAGKLYDSSHWDVVSAVEEGAEMEEFEVENLPAELQAMTADEREDYVKEQSAKRETLRVEISELDRKRRDFIAEARKADESAEDGLDDVLQKGLRTLAEDNGFTFVD